MDVGIAAETIVLTAFESGIASCVMGTIERERIKGVLEIPNSFEVPLVIALGYPLEKSVAEDETKGIPYGVDEKGIMHIPKRPLEKVDFTPGQKFDEIRCFMEQGFLCQGPATRSGCGGTEKIPRCVKAYMTCRGCFGPIRAGANPMVDMMGALSSIGLDPKEIEDRMATFNRFIGVVGRLRPLPAR